MANATCQPARTLPKFRPRVLHGIHGQRFPRQGAGIHLLWYGGHDSSARCLSWMVLGGWLFCGDPRPSLVQFFGLGTGFAGLILLASIRRASGTDSGVGHPACAVRRFGWVTGSFLSKKQASETQLSVIQTSGLLMFIGGLQSLVGAAVLGEFSTFSMNSVDSAERGGAALSGHLWSDHRLHLLFLAVAAHAHRVAISYEYVNPVIGVFLGWLLAGEQVDGVIVTACCLTVLSVFFIVSRKHG